MASCLSYQMTLLHNMLSMDGAERGMVLSRKSEKHGMVEEFIETKVEDI